MHVSDTQWEDFIEHACRQRLVNGDKYVQVVRLGNANDKGRDVEARLQATLVPDGWDLYQAKHYGNRLTPGNAYPEMAKFFGHLLKKSYPTPRKYYFCAPRNAGPELHDLLADPEALREAFLSAWKGGTHALDAGLLTPQMSSLVNGFDFSRFEECLVHDLIGWHALDTSAHYKLFGIEPERGDDPDVPPTAQVDEMTYVNELVKVYSEHSGEKLSLDDVVASEMYRDHFESARVAFYSAEGLRRFSRDIYPEDEFNKLLEMVKKGVRPSAYSPRHKTGLERHDAAIDAAAKLTVTDSVLYPRLRGGDLPGTCHHLVNDGDLKWVR
ncbi:ABC-three component system protein [Chromobacterium haemolyticum]|uniref:ABC-three component system protein n=1 Tax=Chromobacterium haemolyticum TaxID=394935 RepID=UPI001B3C13F7|nr:ABC-three component system protein [Chromobacterium haemolyticum]